MKTEVDGGSGLRRALGMTPGPDSQSSTIAATDVLATSGRQLRHSQAFGGQMTRTRCRLGAGLHDVPRKLIACRQLEQQVIQ